MKIGITCYPTFGGSGIVATELGKKLSDRGHEIHFISSSLPYRLKYHSGRNLFFHEVEKVEYPLFESSPYILLLASKMAEVSESAGLDVLHVHYAIPHALSAHLARQIVKKRPPKVVTTLHGTDVTLIGNLRSLKNLTRFSIDQSDGVTAVSDFLKRKTEETFNLRKPIQVIHNFVDTADFHPAARDDGYRLEKRKGEKFLVHISNFRKVKRIPDVVDIFKGVAEKTPCRLLMVGDGPEMGAAKERIEAYGLSDRTMFLGLVDNVAPLLGWCDLLLQVSDHESFGLSSLEALACGVPVIGTSGSGLDEVVTHGKNGYLSPPGQVAQMTADALGLLADPARWRAFSEHGAQWASKNFASERIVKSYEDFYQGVVAA